MIRERETVINPVGSTSHLGRLSEIGLSEKCDDSLVNPNLISTKENNKYIKA